MRGRVRDRGRGVAAATTTTPPRIDIQDNFNRADTSGVMGTSSDGHLWVDDGTGGGRAGITSNKVTYNAGSGGQPIPYVTGTVSDSVVQFSCSGVIASSDGGVVARRSGVGGSWSGLLLEVGLNWWQLDRVTNGSITVLGSGAVSYTHYRLTLNGSSVSALGSDDLVSWVPLVTVVETQNQTSCVFGFCFFGGFNIYFDNFSVTTL